jgi:imidazolonepropionase
MPVLKNIGRLATCRAAGGQGDVHPIAAAALAFRGGRITWVGPERDLPASEDDGDAWDARGRLVIPGLVDAHTHLAFGGWRADEFVERLKGATYAEIAKRGGGIASTVRQTRALDKPALLARSRGFLDGMLALGVTTVEAKSGYGLDETTERRTLEVYRELGLGGPPRVVPTYLGAHVVPAEHRADRAAYVGLVERLIPVFAKEGLAHFVDVFVEDGAFTAAEARRLAAAAKAAGLAVKLHVDQLSSGGGAELAAELGAVSADHLEHVSDAGVAALAKAGTVAVALPVAGMNLGAPPMPARKLIAAGVPVAVASDFNPGTAPSYHLPWALSLACAQLKLTPSEALKAATLWAARASGVESEVGSLEPGKAADVVVIDAPDEDHWLYHVRANAALLVAVNGVKRFNPSARAPSA